MKRIVLAFTLMGAFVFSVKGAFADTNTISSRITEKLTIGADGSVNIKQTEVVPGSPLQDIFERHSQDMAKDKSIQDGYLKELKKRFYLRFHATPDLKIASEANGTEFKRSVSGKVGGMVETDEKDKTLRSISMKKYENEKEADKLLAYFEQVIDGTAFESVFLISEKGEQNLETESETIFELPKGATIMNLKELTDKTWSVDFGGGNMMKANLSVDEKSGIVTLKETRIVTEESPKILMNEKNEGLFDDLREYAQFEIKYKLPEGSYACNGATSTSGGNADLDWSGSWSFDASHTFSHGFQWQQLTVTPSATLGLNLGASVMWEHHWVKINWYTYRWRLKKFQTTISANPSLGLSVTVNSGAQLSHDWDYNVITKTTTISFFVFCVPVYIVLEAKLNLGATASLGGDITVTTGVTLNLNTSLTAKYEGGWSLSASKTFTPSFNGFTADAQLQASARGEAPFTLSAYIYYVAGPFAQLVPYLQGDAWAKVGTTNQVGYKIVGGMDVNGGVSLSGWLKDMIGGVGSYSNTFYNLQTTISEGTKNIGQ